MSKRIVSIFDKKDDDQEHDYGQAFYAGGSEHSGQQILGPERDNNLIENLLNDARRHAEGNPTPSNQTLPITLWRNGFTVGDDNELRDYASNRQFLDCLRRGEVPPELAARVRGGMIDVKLDNKAFQDYKPEQRSQVFAGEGHRLGAPAPTVVNDQEQQHQSSSGTTSSANPSAESGLSLDEVRLKRLARFSQKPKQ